MVQYGRGLLGLKLFAGIVLAGQILSGFAHPADENPALALPETTRQFRQDRFGILINWGVYSTLCDGADVKQERGLTAAEYNKLPRFFNPAKFDAADWVMLAKTAGANYITFSAKSDDGFAMWNSLASDWNVVKQTPFGRDVLRAISEECLRNGIKLYLSYAPVDWHSHLPDLNRSAGETRKMAVATDQMTTASLAFTRAQITELLTRYDAISGVWLDNWWKGEGAVQALQEMCHEIRHLQPNALIGINHSSATLPDENFEVRLRTFPRQDPDAATLAYRKTPMAVSDTVNDSWAFQLDDTNFKSTRDLVHKLVTAAGHDCNLLLGIGPMPNGEVQPEIRERLLRMGLWMAKHGESIYDTRGGPVPPQPWGVTTHRNRKVYMHVLDAETTSITVNLPQALRIARYFSDNTRVKTTRDGEKVTLDLRPERRDELERLIVLETQEYE